MNAGLQLLLCALLAIHRANLNPVTVWTGAEHVNKYLTDNIQIIDVQIT